MGVGLSYGLKGYKQGLRESIHSLKAPVISGKGCRLFLPLNSTPFRIAPDLSGHRNHGTVYGATLQDIGEEYLVKFKNRLVKVGGKALYFDGVDDYGDCGDDESLRITDELTIEVWVKCYRVSGVDEDIVGKKTYEGYRIGAHNNRIRATIKTSGYNDLNFSNPQLGIWYYVNLTFKKDNFARLYVNNGLEAKKEGASLYSGPIQDTTGSSLILGKGIYSGGFFYGLIALLRICGRVLSERERSQHFELERVIFGV